jgi:hypothetical protein
MLIRKGGALVVGAGLVMLTGGCPLIEIEAEVQEVCLTYADLSIPGSDGTGTVVHDFVFDDLVSIDEIEQLDGNVEFVHVKLRAKSGVSDFGFLDAAHVTVTSGDAASTLPALTVVDCSGDGCPTEGSEITLLSSEPGDALAYLRSGSVAVSLEVTGDLPTSAWTVDVDVCVKGKVRFTQGI